MSDIQDILKRQAEDIAKAGHTGWGNTMIDAETEIEKLEERVKEFARLLSERDGGVHDVDCKVYKYGGCNCGHIEVVAALKEKDHE